MSEEEPAPQEPEESADHITPRYFDPSSGGPGLYGPAEPDTPEETASGVPPDAEQRGINRAQWASLTAVLGLAVAGIAPLALIYLSGIAPPIPILGMLLGPLFGSATMTISLLYGLLGLVAAGVVLDVVAFILYTTSFGLLRHVDAGFRAPRALGIVGIVGFLILTIGPLIVLVSIFSAVNCASSSACSVDQTTFLATVGGALIASALGAIIAFVGWIGLILGVFRMGTRYNSGLLKVAAILFIIPLASIVAPILAFVALRRVSPVGEVAAAG